MSKCAPPHDFIHKPRAAENLIQNQFCVMTHPGIEMHIDASCLVQQFVQDHDGLVKPFKVRIEMRLCATPDVPVRLVFDNAGLFRECERVVFF
jgi:hypothetical protein